jgi:hypothetical protein
LAEVESAVVRAGGGRDEAVAAVAGRQRGQLTRRQMLRLGIDPAVIDRWLASGRLIPRHRGVYALGHLALPPFADEMAAVLACGDRAFVSHESAAAIWGIRCPPPPDGHVQVLVVGRKLHSRPGIDVHHTATIDQFDGWIRDGVPVTSAARTVIDLMPRLGARERERALDSALHEQLVAHGAMRWAAERAGRRRGTAALKLLLDPGRPTANTRSGNEERMLELCRRAGLPPPELNVPLGRFVVDFLWREHAVAVEIDSYHFHRARSRFNADRAKDAYLQSLGIAALRFTEDQLAGEHELLLVRLARTLFSEAPRRAAGA